MLATTIPSLKTVSPMDEITPKRFNAAGPCDPTRDYALPILPRLDAMGMIDGGYYFVLRAPPHSGKTAYLNALRDKIISDGNYYALLCSLKDLDGISDVETATAGVVSQINDSLRISQVKKLVKLSRPNDLPPQYHFSFRIRSILNYICLNLDKDLVIFFDDADRLAPEPLISFLGQIRQGHNIKNSATSQFPRSLALVGARDVRDYLSQVRPRPESKLLASPFDFIKGALSLRNFTKDEMRDLFAQGAAEAGPVFSPSAIERAWVWSEGQPFLSNALASEIAQSSPAGDYSKAVTGKRVDRAAQATLGRREPRFDWLRKRIQEPKTRRIMEAILVGDKDFPPGVSSLDIQYALDLGLLREDISGAYRPANLFYQEIIVWALTFRIQNAIEDDPPDMGGRSWAREKSLDMSALLLCFQAFWRERREILVADCLGDDLGLIGADQVARFRSLMDHNANRILSAKSQNRLCALANAALAHLALIAFARAVLQGDAFRIQTEFALGRQSAALRVSYKGRLYPLEITVKGEQAREIGPRRLLDFMDNHVASEGWLIVFDEDPRKTWDQKLTWETIARDGRTTRVVGC
ncbi:MAG: hypothetical protein LBO66_06615 [Deltaproteobacteria bacterium]|nr:hypothetical protein [Deltaproteobacteria bacterium]